MHGIRVRVDPSFSFPLNEFTVHGRLFRYVDELLLSLMLLALYCTHAGVEVAAVSSQSNDMLSHSFVASVRFPKNRRHMQKLHSKTITWRRSVECER